MMRLSCRHRKQIHPRFLKQTVPDLGQTGSFSQTHHVGLIPMNQAPVEEMIHQASGGIACMEIAKNERPPGQDMNDPGLQTCHDPIIEVINQANE